MTKTQILDAIRLMQPEERLEIMEFTVRLMRAEITETAAHRQFNFAENHRKSLAGCLKGTFALPLPDDFNEPLDEFAEYME